jgi:hypothetical protein
MNTKKVEISLEQFEWLKHALQSSNDVVNSWYKIETYYDEDAGITVNNAQLELSWANSFFQRGLNEFISIISSYENTVFRPNGASQDVIIDTPVFCFPFIIAFLYGYALLQEKNDVYRGIIKPLIIKFEDVDSSF